MQRLCVLVGLLAAGCTSGRDPVDPVPGCGNGIIEPDQIILPWGLAEECDDGPMTGQPGSLCSLQCQDQTVGVEIVQEQALPIPARKLIRAIDSPAGEWLVVSNFDDRGIALVSTEGPESFVLSAHGTPVDFTVGYVHEAPGETDYDPEVIWIEAAVPGVGGPWLLWAEIGEEPEPVIHEVPFPIPGATQGVFERYIDSGTPILLSAGSGGRLHVARMFWPAGPGGHVEVDDVGPAATPSIALRVDGDALDTPDEEFSRLAHFAGGNPADVVVAKYDYPHFQAPPTLDYRGIWPGVILSADNGGWTPNAVSRAQVAMLAPDGVVNVWDFNRDLDEIEPIYYGTMPAGTQQLASTDPDGGSGCWVPFCGVIGVVPDGSIALLQNNGAGRALDTQQFAIGPSCSVCSLEHQRRDAKPVWYAFDDVAIKVRFRPWYQMD